MLEGLGVTGWEVRKEGCENGVAEGFVKASFPSNQPFFFLVANKTTRSTGHTPPLEFEVSLSHLIESNYQHVFDSDSGSGRVCMRAVGCRYVEGTLKRGSSLDE